MSYICSGPGALMGLYAPPLLSRNDGASFAITNTPGQSFAFGPFTATLLSVSPLTGLLNIDISNISLVNLEVVCENGPPGMLDTTRVNVVKAGKLDSNKLLIPIYTNLLQME